MARKPRPYMAANAEPSQTQENKPAPKKRMGRPTSFSPKLAKRIFDRMACGETLTEICRSPSMPDRSTVRRWLSRHPDLISQYQRARELLADTLFDQVLDIADDARGDVTIDGNGKRQVDWENVNRSKLRVDARKWVAAKLAPHKYGERVQHTGANDGPIEFARTDPLTSAEVAAELSGLFNVAERELGLPSGDGKTSEERAETIKNARGGVLPPALYSVLWQHERGQDDAPH